MAHLFGVIIITFVTELIGPFLTFLFNLSSVYLATRGFIYTCILLSLC